MNNQNWKMRSVKVNNRGQIVIPEDIRTDLKINLPSTLILIEKEGKIVLRKESDVVEELKDEDAAFKALSRHSTEKAWDKKDKIWDEIYKEWSKKT